jgi:predicted TIM-barrel fold metal-dependent hydrolase
LLFADVSYLSELFSPKDRKRCIDRLQLYLNLDPGARHLVFGSDWVMLGIEKEYPKGGGYPHRVAALLADAGLGEEAIDGVMYRNALRLYGLDSDSVARRRLLGFYERHGLPATRLPS